MSSDRSLRSMLLLALALVAGNIAPANAETVAFGAVHGCAIDASGRVRCFGISALGTGSFGPQYYPADVTALPGAQESVIAGFGFTCSLADAGSEVHCWGYGTRGQLGNGDGANSPLPTVVVDLEVPVSAIASGYAHACALSESGGVQCWGRNDSGQAGNPSLADNLTPASVGGLVSGVEQISAGDNFTCALADGHVYCWGANFDGQLGAIAPELSATPLEVPLLGDDVLAISSGGRHTCALKSDNSVMCWGDGYALPAPVSGLAGDIEGLAAGSSHDCVLYADSSVACWGGNQFGELGNGMTGAPSEPVMVQGLTGPISEVDAGLHQTCVVGPEHEIRCWGGNFSGELGIDSRAESLVPVRVRELPLPVLSVATARSSSCAVLADHSARCWGSNYSGEIGSGNDLFALHPQTVVSVLGDYVEISGGDNHFCALTGSGRVECWGRSYANGSATQENQAVLIGTDATPLMTQIAAGDAFNCARTVSGGAQCWGIGNAGTLGNGTTSSSTVPVAVTGLASGVVIVDGGSAHACAALGMAGASCWGANYTYQLGDESVPEYSAVPVAVKELPGNTVAVALSSGGSCSLSSESQVHCWGSNIRGERGDEDPNPTATPLLVQGLPDDIVAIAAGSMHVCALRSSGGVMCWGENSVGELGNGTADSWHVPTAVTGIEDAVSITASATHSCARLGDGSQRCWGGNTSAQLGDGNAGTWPLPQRMLIDTLFRGHFEFSRSRFD